jgi:long-chain acyl-CoA synthetase
MDSSQLVLTALQGDPAAPMFEFRGRRHSRGEIRALGERVVESLIRAGVTPETKIGVVVRNRVLHAATMLGLIAHGWALTTIYSMQSAESLAAEIEESRFGAVIADEEDWTPQLETAARSAGSLGLVLNHVSIGLSPHSRLGTIGPGPFAQRDREPGLEVLSSGTTGKPKRIRFPYRLLIRAVESVRAAGAQADPDPDILTWPYGGIGGICSLVASAVIGRHTVILEKFNVAEWIDAVRRYRPRVLTGPPAVARMALDAKVAPEDLASVAYFYGGSAPMTPELQDAFEAAYDLKVIWAYGATEFYGTIISWTPALHESHGRTKKGAMGRPLPGVQVRAVDPESGAPLRAGETGYLEALVPTVSEDWIRTTDLVIVDEDDFVFHKGRGDGAIVRGGFKVLPEKVVESLQKHPSVLEAAVVGIADARLGEAPVAAVELRAGAAATTEAELREHVKRELPAHHAPTRIMIVSALPRTSSMKPDLGAIRRLFQSEAAAL